MSWFYTGQQAEQITAQEEKQRQERAENNGNKIFRFYIPVGVETQITFLDDNTLPGGLKSPFLFREHQLNRNGTWKGNNYTCIQGHEDESGNTPDCPLCASGERASTMYAYTIVDHTEWISKKSGKVHKSEVKLFVCKSKVHKLLQKYKEKNKCGGSLRGCTFNVSRTDTLSPNTGDVFDFEDKVDLDPSLQPADYLKEFEPRSLSELKALVGVVVADDDALDY